MTIKIVSMGKIMFSGEAGQISVPAKKGMVEILSGHADSVFKLKKGFVGVNGRIIEVFGGFCKVIKNNVVILLE